LLVWIFLIALTPASYGASVEDALYEEALSAFRSGDYERAMSGFLDANAAGRDDAALHYNLGSCYYKLERYEKAAAAFSRAAALDAEMAPLARYNLGLVAYQQGDNDVAGAFFRQTLETADNAKLRNLAAAMLARIDSDATTDSPTLPPWSGFIEVGYGDDDNVTLTSADQAIQTTDLQDRFMEATAYGSRRLSGDYRRGVRLAASVYALRYLTLKDYNTSTVHAGIGRDNTYGPWRIATDLDVNQAYLAHSPFTRTTVISILGRRRLPGIDQLRLRYRLSRIEELATAYDYLEGWRNELDGSLRWHLGDTRLRLDYEYETNDREDRHTTPFISVSPTRHTLRGRLTQPLAPQFSAVLDYQYRYSLYRDPNEVAPGVYQTREDDYYRTRASLVYALADDKELSLEYRFTDNRSNIPSYAYDRREITLSFFMDW
jgi:tetratricopeptide (TPR) repeat protein